MKNAKNHVNNNQILPNQKNFTNIRPRINSIDAEAETSPSTSKKQNDVFLIRKIKRNKSDDNEDSSVFSEDESFLTVNSDRKRIDACSKVNFQKLDNVEKDSRLKNLAKLVKKLRRKVRNLENRFKYSANKVINKYIHHSLKTNEKSSLISFDNPDINIEKMCRAMNILKFNEDCEFEDEKNLIENIIYLIAEKKLSTDSINFKKISSLIRMCLDPDKINFLKRELPNVIFAFPEKEIHITNSEFNFYNSIKNNEDMMRIIFGLDPKLRINDQRIVSKDSSCNKFKNDQNKEKNNLSKVSSKTLLDGTPKL